jgi:hemerythrin-like domain-containing protein
MTTATQNLENDHEHILQLIEVMYAMVNKKASDPAHFETVISVIRNFADGLHHAKEENLLFPSMANKGFAMDQGPIAVMLHDHEQGRNYVKQMSQGLHQLKQGDAKALQVIYDNMIWYGQLLQSHIGKENNVLFRMADKILSENEQQDLLTKFEEIETNNNNGTNKSEHIKAINALKMFYK